MMNSPAVFRGQRVLVTGAGGFIGSHLCRRLRESGVRVQAVYRNSPPALESGLEGWRCDLHDPVQVEKLIGKTRPELIFHLASHVSGARDLATVQACLRDVLVSSVNVMTAAAEVGCGRVILTGSLEEAEPGASDSVPSSGYAAAKWAVSGYARMFHALYGLPVVIARVFMVYGPGQRDLRKLIPYVIISLLRGEAPRLTDGERPVDWIYVDDVVEGLLAMARTPGIEGSRIDLGSGTMVAVRSVVSQLTRLIPSAAEPIFGALPPRAMEQVRVADGSRSFEVLGWRPTVSLEEGLKQTAEWYETQLRNGSLQSAGTDKL